MSQEEQRNGERSYCIGLKVSKAVVILSKKGLWGLGGGDHSVFVIHLQFLLCCLKWSNGNISGSDAMFLCQALIVLCVLW